MNIGTQDASSEPTNGQGTDVIGGLIVLAFFAVVVTLLVLGYKHFNDEMIEREKAHHAFMAKEDERLKAAQERLKAPISSEPWITCVDPLLSRDSRPEGVSLLVASRTEIGTKYVLLSKHRIASWNKVYECELSAAGDFVSIRPRP